jgi:Abnormal spindle-like microcephaly-assoc'd, ASPM-SPD-2-Hydin
MRLPQSHTQRSFLRLFRVVCSTTILLGLISTTSYATPQAKSLSCWPTNLGFGDVSVGQSESLLATVTNNGQASMTITAINVSNPAFSIPAMSLPLVLSTGQSIDLMVIFSPTNTGWMGGKITFVAAAANQSVSLSLGGTGATSIGLTANPPSVSFGQTSVGSSSQATVVLTNTRSYPMPLSAARISGTGYSLGGANFPMTLSAGQSVTLSVTFAPQAAGMSGGRIFIVGPALSVPLLGTGETAPVIGQLSLSPSALSFGNVTVGSSATLPATLSASGASVTISSATSSNGQFTMPGVSFPMTIPAGKSVSLSVVFSPQTSGASSGALAFASNASNSSVAESLSGTGTAAVTQGQLVMSPSSLSFGNVTVGTTSSLPATLTASGASVTISSAASSSGLFSMPGVSFPLTINSGQSVALNVVFSPQSSGTASGTLTFASNASNSPAAEALSGTGAMPYVSLSWGPSTSQVSGYNVYRCPVANCTYAKMNSSPMANTSFTDSNVSLGQSYYYVTTAVSTSGVESGYSNQVEAVIP